MAVMQEFEVSKIEVDREGRRTIKSQQRIAYEPHELKKIQSTFQLL